MDASCAYGGDDATRLPETQRAERGTQVEVGVDRSGGVAVAEVHDTAGKSALVHQLELGARVPRQRRLASADEHGSVSVRSRDDRGVVGIGTVAPDETYQFREVVEHGDAWVVIFSSAGVVGGDLSLSRQQLDERDWIITIPMEVDRELAASGVKPSP
jgi:hypothetical protein